MLWYTVFRTFLGYSTHRPDNHPGSSRSSKSSTECSAANPTPSRGTYSPTSQLWKVKAMIPSIIYPAERKSPKSGDLRKTHQVGVFLSFASISVAMGRKTPIQADRASSWMNPCISCPTSSPSCSWASRRRTHTADGDHISWL
jgi:hypothetical protein